MNQERKASEMIGRRKEQNEVLERALLKEIKKENVVPGKAREKEPRNQNAAAAQEEGIQGKKIEKEVGVEIEIKTEGKINIPKVPEKDEFIIKIKFYLIFLL